MSSFFFVDPILVLRRQLPPYVCQTLRHTSGMLSHCPVNPLHMHLFPMVPTEKCRCLWQNLELREARLNEVVNKKPVLSVHSGYGECFPLVL